MICNACGHENVAGDRFCAGCGATLQPQASAVGGATANAAGGPVAAGVGVSALMARQLPWLVALVFVLLAAIVVQNFMLIGYFRRVTLAPWSGATASGHGEAGSHPSHAAQPAAVIQPENQDEEILFTAIMTPCGQCNLPLIDNNCVHAHGALEAKQQIREMLHQGKGKKEIFGVFVERYGERVLTPQAQAILKQARASKS